MKRFNRYLGLVMASTMVLSMTSCNKLSVNAETNAPAEVSSNSTASSEEISASAETKETQTKSSKSLEDDLYNVYAEPAYSLPNVILSIAQDHDSTWHEQVCFTLDKGTLVEVYDINDKEIAEARWKISQPERVNDYSFKIKITDLESSSFTDIKLPDEYCKLNKGDELIIYLPNTPIKETPAKVIGSRQSSRTPPEDDRLQTFGVYNPASDGACRVILNAMLASDKTSAEDMKNWYGEYFSEDGEQVKIYEDSSTREPRVDLVYAGSKQCNGMQVRKVKDDPNELYAFGKADDGSVIIIGLVHADSGYSLRVYESPECDAEKFPEGISLALNKKNNKDTGDK